MRAKSWTSVAVLIAGLAFTSGCSTHATDHCDELADHVVAVSSTELAGLVPTERRSHLNAQLETQRRKVTEQCQKQPLEKAKFDCVMKASSIAALRTCGFE